MNTHENDPFDEELETLARRYRDETSDEPPELLDRAVLNHARRAVETSAERPWSFGWMHATATAALVVLGLTVVMQLREVGNAPESMQEADQSLQDRSTVPERNEAQTLNELERFRKEEAEVLDSMQEQQKSQALRALRDDAMRAPDLQADTAVPTLIIRPAPPLREQNEGAREPGAETGDRDRSAIARRASQNEHRAVGVGAAASPPAGQDVGGDMLQFSSAEEWLDYIIGLWQLGEEQAWRSELHTFRQAFPDHTVPQDLLEEAATVPGQANTDG